MGKQTTTTSITCNVPIPSCDHDILAAISQLSDNAVSFTNKADALDLKITSSNSFTKKKTENSAISLLGCVRALCKGSDMFCAEDPEGAMQVESWINASEQTLLPILRHKSNGHLLLETVQDFCTKIANHLSASTYLVGDEPTAADVCVAIPLAVVALEHFTTLTWPDKSFAWLTTVLGQLSSIGGMGGWTKYASLKKDGAAPAAGAVAPAPAADSGDNKILNLLKEHGVEYTAYEHPLSKTADELIQNAPLADGETHTKNLFLKDKKHGLFLISVAANAKETTPVQTKEIAKLIGLKGKTNLRMADEKILMDCLQAKPGCVGPLCAGIAQGDEKVTLVLDATLTTSKYSKVHSHPLRNDMSVSMTPAAMMECLKKAGVEPTVLEFPAATGGGGAPAPAPAPKQQKKGGGGGGGGGKKANKKGETLLALQCTKSENFAQWYTDVIVLSEMISYYDISGCYILRPWSYKIWELMQNWFNAEIQKIGVENCYFPLFVSQDRLEKEKDHVEGFAPEVAWVTKSGDGELAKPIAVRPTSETIMYPAFSDWIKSHRDLPLLLNQWSNVVRWEFKYPTPFLRSREFLWQEGHTAHATYEEANTMVMQALEFYRRVYEELLACPVVPGKKTEKEKFAGGSMTTTVEAYIAGSGRAIQGATSHNLGQNFGKMFDITFQDEKGTTQTAWQTSWGLTTRTIGVMIMVHGDDKGLVLPPRVAPLQVVIVPIVSKKLPMDQAAPYCQSILKDLEEVGIRAKFDDRDMYNPGWKYNHWEQKGVPIRIEVGPRDIEQKQARCVLRYNGDKMDLAVDGLGKTLKEKLDEIQGNMFTKAKEARDSHLVHVTEWKDFVPNLELNNLVLTPWCGGEHEDWEDWVKNTSREESLKSRGEEGEDEKTATSLAAKTLCIPFDQPELPEGTKCIASGLPATCWVLWGRSY